LMPSLQSVPFGTVGENPHQLSKVTVIFQTKSLVGWNMIVLGRAETWYEASTPVHAHAQQNASMRPTRSQSD
jgi:hypothetical protein